MTFAVFLIIWCLALGSVAVILAFGTYRSAGFDKEMERKHIEDPEEWDRKLKEKGFRK